MNCAVILGVPTVGGRRPRTGFSLLELVIVVVIIGIVAAIAIPRMSRGATGAADAALRADLSVMRSAIDLYATEHGGGFPDEGGVALQLTRYTDKSSAVSATKTTTHIYGPYLRATPPVPVGPQKGSTTIEPNPGAGIGWVYDEGTGEIYANTGGDTDEQGVLYSDY